MNKRRAKYGLKAAKRPVILSHGARKYPLGKGLAKAEDQKAMSDEDYTGYAQFYLDNS